jgi:hypothetical protein
MNTYLSRRIPVVVVAALALAMLALGFLAALGVRSLVVGTASAGPAAPNPGHEWSQVEGHGVDGSTYWLGTTADQALELRVNGSRVVRLEAGTDPVYGSAANFIAGYSGNSVTDGVGAATIAGGGAADDGSGNPGANRVTDSGGTVGGGAKNQAGDDAGTTIDAWFATVGGGVQNTAGSGYATVGGGGNNVAGGEGATVGGGASNSATGQFYATVAGGYHNTASDTLATVGGGSDNQATVNATTIAGGHENTASAEGATVSGGGQNTASGFAAVVSGGSGNTASGQGAVVAGGGPNTASGEGATVAGGGTNSANGRAAAVGGGTVNTASGEAATVPGGAYNTAQGLVSFAAGYRAKANNQGCFVWGDLTNADVACNNDNRFIARASGGVYLYTSGNLSTGAYLASGSGSWSDVSSRDVKDNFTPVDGREVLARLAEVPISTWNHKTQDASIRHMGPMAQDFYAAFDLGESETAITTVDADGVALAAIQGLYELSQEQATRIQALETQNASLQQRLDNLEARVSALEGNGTNAAVSQASASGLPAAWLVVGGGMVLVLGGLVLVQRRLAGGRR